MGRGKQKEWARRDKKSDPFVRQKNRTTNEYRQFPRLKWVVHSVHEVKISQRLPDDLEEKITSFQSFVIRARRSKNYSLVNIGNMDETPVWFDMPTSKTVDSVGAKTVLLKTNGHEKTRFTVVLACLADGTKLKPMVIFKQKTMPKDNFPAGVVVHVHNHPKGWMDESGVKIWIEKVWRARPG